MFRIEHHVHHHGPVADPWLRAQLGRLEEKLDQLLSGQRSGNEEEQRMTEEVQTLIDTVKANETVEEGISTTVAGLTDTTGRTLSLISDLVGQIGQAAGDKQAVLDLVDQVKAHTSKAQADNAAIAASSQQLSDAIVANTPAAPAPPADQAPPADTGGQTGG